ncbi:MAG TPA: PAS domain S-box protein [Dissulfurispiraceae bacterium]|nr:PAS domain S-box protein [Dissulfurispiraceae bacterium]
MKKFRKIDSLVKELDNMRRKYDRVQQCKTALENIQKKYEKLLESSPDAMLFINSNGIIVFVNAQFERLFGYAESEVVGSDISMLIPQRFRDQHHKNVSEFFSSPRTRPMGVGLRIFGLRKDETEFPADISLNPMQADGELLATAAVRDMTERRRAEELIERNYHIQRVISSILKTALEPIPLAEQMDQVLELIFSMPGLAFESRGFIYLVDDDSKDLVLKAPRTVQSMDQPPCEKIVMGKCMCSVGESMCSAFFSECTGEGAQFREGSPHGHYCVPIASAGRLLGIINIHVEQGHRRSVEEEEFLTAVANTLAGVIVRQQADLEKQRLQERLAQAEKFSALGRITANVADEFRNPLTAVGGFARRLRKAVADGPAEEYASSIISEVTRLETILHDVLIFSGAAGNHRGLYDPREILDEAASFYKERCAEQSVVVNRIYGDVQQVRIERNQLLEAVKQLLNNALDAMPRGGTLSISVSSETVDGMSYAAVAVGDTGAGIPEDKLNLIFEPFFSTKLKPKGTGLGLSITRKVAEDHQGFVAAANKADGGAAFTLYLPMQD